MLRVLLAIGILLAVAFLALEIRGWRAGTKIVNSKQKALRVAATFLMITVMVMVLVGDRWVAAYSPFGALAYWVVCLGLTIGLLLLALLDLREIGLGYGEEKKKILRHLAKRTEEDADDG